eukprot:737493-Pyramimonas_sp.AAC.1
MAWLPAVLMASAALAVPAQTALRAGFPCGAADSGGLGNASGGAPRGGADGAPAGIGSAPGAGASGLGGRG